MGCRFCSGENVIKSGKVRNKQRYKCKECKKYFVIELSVRGYDQNIKLQALEMIKEGVGFRSISRLLKVSLSGILKWFKNRALIIKQIVNNKAIDIILLDLEEEPVVTLNLL